MYIVESIKEIAPFSGNLGLTIGNFEGFHKGHARLVATLVNESRKRGLFSALLTFKQHPLKVLRGREPEKLWSFGDKIERFRQEGVDLLICLDFTPQFAKTTPLDFIEVLVRTLSPRFICLGNSFRFGRNNEGDVVLLRREALHYHYELITVENVLFNGEPISSTKIRQAIKAGNIELARVMLDRAYYVYVTPDPEGSMKLFVPNMILPDNGLFVGEAENLFTKGREEGMLTLRNGTIVSFENREPDTSRLYRFYFGGSMEEK